MLRYSNPINIMVPGDTLTELGLFWLAYLFVFVVLLARPRTRVTALVFCVVATVLVPLMWLVQ
jgi:hypothetical protein